MLCLNLLFSLPFIAHIVYIYLEEFFKIIELPWNSHDDDDDYDDDNDDGLIKNVRANYRWMYRFTVEIFLIHR